MAGAPAYDKLTLWLEEAATRVGAGGACFHLRSRDGRRIICQAVTRSVRATHLAYGLDLSDCPAVGEALETGRTIAVDDAALDHRVAQIARERFGLRSVLYQPVQLGGLSEAVAIFHHRTPHWWTADEIAEATGAADEARAILEPTMAGLAQQPSNDLADAMLSAVPGVTSLVDDGLITFASSASLRQDAPLEAQATAITVDELLSGSDRGQELRAALQNILQGELDRFQGLLRTAVGAWWVHARPVRLPEPSARTAVSVEARPLDALGVHVQSLPTDTPDAMTESEERHRLQALGRIAGSVAHEVNNALQIIRLSLDELDACEGVETAREATERAAGVTSQLLTFARKAPTQVRPVNLEDFLTREIPIVRRALGSDHPLGLRLRSSPIVLLDARKMSMALLNLCKNAAEASPPGSEVIIELGVTRHLDRDWAQVAVLDRGGGMPTEVIEGLGSFVVSSKPEGHGAGIGLAVVQQVVDEHAGTLQVETPPEGGTRVRVLLPLRDAPAPRGPPPESNPRGASPKILIVEDEAPLARIMARVASEAGLEPQTTATLASARAAFDADPSWPDAVVLDLTLPDGRGIELFRELRERRPDLPVLAVSGFAEREATLELSRCGCPLLVKPFGGEELAQALRRLLGA